MSIELHPRVFDAYTRDRSTPMADKVSEEGEDVMI